MSSIVEHRSTPLPYSNCIVMVGRFEHEDSGWNLGKYSIQSGMEKSQNVFKLWTLCKGQNQKYDIETYIKQYCIRTKSQIVRNQHLVHFPVKRSSIPDNSPRTFASRPGEAARERPGGNTSDAWKMPSTQVWWIVRCLWNVYGISQGK